MIANVVKNKSEIQQNIDKMVAKYGEWAATYMIHYRFNTDGDIFKILVENDELEGFKLLCDDYNIQCTSQLHTPPPTVLTEISFIRYVVSINFSSLQKAWKRIDEEIFGINANQ